MSDFHIGFIGSGYSNCINAWAGAMVGGAYNKIEGNFNFIGGGCRNCVESPFSAILGGYSNCDNGFGSVGMFGTYLSASSANTFFVNCLNACDTPAATIGGLPPGTFAFVTAGGGGTVPPGAKVLVLI